jgi:hypothetical protein
MGADRPATASRICALLNQSSSICRSLSGNLEPSAEFVVSSTVMRPVQSVVVSMPPAGASFLLPDQCPRGPVTPQKQLQRATTPGHRGTERRTSRIAAVRGQSIADRGQCAGHSRRHAGSAEDGRLRTRLLSVVQRPWSDARGRVSFWAGLLSWSSLGVF